MSRYQWDMAPDAVEDFRHVGYPQQLRVLLGIGKLGGAAVRPTTSSGALVGIVTTWVLLLRSGARPALSKCGAGTVRILSERPWEPRSARV